MGLWRRACDLIYNLVIIRTKRRVIEKRAVAKKRGTKKREEQSIRVHKLHSEPNFDWSISRKRCFIFHLSLTFTCTNCWDMAFCELNGSENIYSVRIKLARLRHDYDTAEEYTSSPFNWLTRVYKLLDVIVCLWYQKRNWKGQLLMNFICSSFKRTLCFVYLRRTANARHHVHTRFKFAYSIYSGCWRYVFFVCSFSIARTQLRCGPCTVCAARMLLLPPPGKTRQRSAQHTK